MNKFHKVLLSLGLCAVMAAPAFGYGWIPGRGEPIPVRESIEAMMRNNHSLKAMQENRSAVGHEVDRAKSGWGPRVDVVARGGFGYLDNTQ